MTKNRNAIKNCSRVILAILVVCALGIVVASGCSKFQSGASNANRNPNVYEADGTEVTINGTITALSKTSITIKKESGETVTAAIGQSTPVLVRSNDGKSETQSLSAIKIGDHVYAGIRWEGKKQVVVGLGTKK